MLRVYASYDSLISVPRTYETYFIMRGLPLSKRFWKQNLAKAMDKNMRVASGFPTLHAEAFPSTTKGSKTRGVISVKPASAIEPLGKNGVALIESCIFFKGVGGRGGSL